MSHVPYHTTAYQMYVFSNVEAIIRSGGGLYSYDDLAVKVGLKPTQHFRRRVNQMVALEILRVVPVFTPRGGIENRFTINESDTGSVQN